MPDGGKKTVGSTGLAVYRISIYNKADDQKFL